MLRDFPCYRAGEAIVSYAHFLLPATVSTQISKQRLPMKFDTSIFIVLAAALPFSTAWDEDPRCHRRKLFDPNEPDPRLIEDGLTIEGIQSRPRINNDNLRNTFRKLRGYNRNLEDITSFQLKLYWEEGYCWQNEWDEREWCLECEGLSCGEDDYLWIKKCDDDENKQRFVYRPISGTEGGHLLPYGRQDLCWEQTRVNAHQLRPCSNEPKQIIMGIQFDGIFEMHPGGQPEKCLEQHHDPKNKEIVRANECETARGDHTNFWIMINKQ